MARYALLCLAPTWTRVARVAVALAAVALAAGCNFKHYDAVHESPTLNTDASVCRSWSARPRWDGGVGGSSNNASSDTGGTAPSILVECPEVDAGSTPPSTDASFVPACAEVDESKFKSHPDPDLYWRFDGSDCSTSEPVSDASVLSLIPQPECDGTVRMNGKGKSLRLNGGQFYKLDGAAPTVDEGFTIAAWISIPQNGLQTPSSGTTTIWPIVSTIGSEQEHCGGYQLDLRLDCEKGPELAFSYVSADCKNSLVEWPLGNPSWSWGTGRWHHVAATYTPPGPPATGTLVLYWDGKGPGNDLNSPAVTSVSNPMGKSSTLYIGTNAQDSSNTNAVKFTGNIDEIALFKQPLSDTQIAAFHLDKTTISGPGGCRWRVTEMRDESVSQWPTSAAWNCYSDDALAITVTDGDWGSGEVSARLAEPGQTRKLSGYSHIYLHAKIPAAGTYNGDFELTLHAGDDSCTWFQIADADNWHEYMVDLANPGYCQTNPREHCAFPLDNVEWASIGSPTEHPVSKLVDPLVYAIDQLELVPLDAGLAPLEIGGRVGPNNWCWRAEAFQVVKKAQAQIQAANSNDAGSNVVKATLCGGASSSPALVADFGDQTIDLSSDLLSIGTDNSPISPELILQDRNGSWVQYSLSSGRQNSTISYTSAQDTAYELGYDGHDQVDNNFKFSPWAKFPPYDSKLITRVKFQKSYLADVPCTAQFDTLAISSVGLGN